jgi:hypothetical protein
MKKLMTKRFEKKNFCYLVIEWIEIHKGSEDDQCRAAALGG